jgi:hypothetical protein
MSNFEVEKLFNEYSEEKIKEDGIDMVEFTNKTLQEELDKLEIEEEDDIIPIVDLNLTTKKVETEVIKLPLSKAQQRSLRRTGKI